MRKLFVLGVSVCVAMAIAGCRGDDDDTGTDGGRRDSGPGVDASVRNTTIQKIQMGMEPEGSIVSVVGAVVTAQKTRTCGTAMCFDVWVQEPAGGMYSGVMLFGVPQAVAATLARGDEVSFTGEVDEFMAGGTTPDTDSVTEIKVSSVTKTGTGKTTPVSTVTPAMLAAKATAEPWEGVLVKIENFMVANAFTSSGTTVSWNVWGGGIVDDELFGLPQGPRSKDCLASAQGPLHYFYGYKIFPRDASDLVTTAGTGCPAFDLEFTMAECTDGVDNDFDGFRDCKMGTTPGTGDFSCESYCASLTPPLVTTAPVALSIATLRGAVPPDNTLIKLTNVIITAIDSRPNGTSASAVNNIWVADNAAAAASQGIMIFAPNEASVAGLSVGQTVTVLGKVLPFTATGGGQEVEIARDPYVFGAAGTTAVVPLDSTLAEANMEDREGVLVRIAAVKAAAAPAMGETLLTPMGTATTPTLVMTDNLIDLASVVANTCFTSVTGIIRHGRCGTSPAFTACYKLDVTALTGAAACN
ncbi:MAG: hypothetical protein IT370_14180 [Deltaproteobacteria bacterium]|nr:hypothetical protein [Deltaproteobacteria bacterium]